MKENKHDETPFFNNYRRLLRSQKGLEGAGEWHLLKQMTPLFKAKRVLDLGCGFGWYCAYVVKESAATVIGIDICKKMLQETNKHHGNVNSTYRCLAVEALDYDDNTFDIVISSRTFHYNASFERICKRVKNSLTVQGTLLFSVEYPVFTAEGNGEWH